MNMLDPWVLFSNHCRKEEFDDLNWNLFKTLALIYHGICLFSLALLNFSLSLVITFFTAPVYCIVKPRKSRYVVYPIEIKYYSLFSMNGMNIWEHQFGLLISLVLGFYQYVRSAMCSLIYQLFNSEQCFANLAWLVLLLVGYWDCKMLYRGNTGNCGSKIL